LAEEHRDGLELELVEDAGGKGELRGFAQRESGLELARRHRAGEEPDETSRVAAMCPLEAPGAGPSARPDAQGK
jgi:hypothetical protein